MSPVCTIVVHMTVRLSISMPDELHAQLVAIANASHVSVAAATRAILSDIVPRMSGLLDYLGTVSPDEARDQLPDVERWEQDVRAVLGAAPEPFAQFRDAFDGNPSTPGEGAAGRAAGGGDGEQ